jgi:hypothetical protein
MLSLSPNFISPTARRDSQDQFTQNGPFLANYFAPLFSLQYRQGSSTSASTKPRHPYNLRIPQRNLDREHRRPLKWQPPLKPPQHPSTISAPSVKSRSWLRQTSPYIPLRNRTHRYCRDPTRRLRGPCGKLVAGDIQHHTWFVVRLES